MHRLNRCLLNLCAAATVGGFIATSHPAFAQTSDADTAPTQTASTQPANRLAVRLRLGDGRQTWHPTRKQIGVTYAPGGSNASPAGAFKFVVNRAKTRAYLNSIAPYIRRAPKNAKVVLAEAKANDDGSEQVPAKVVPGYDGAALNVNAAVDQIQKALEANPATIHLVLPLKTKPARVSAAKLDGIDARIGYFVTRFNPGDEGRTETVRRAISIIDGTIVPPGGIFSVDKVVGPRDPAHGFNGKGHVFVDGHMELQSGGGMCQVATTIFNAAMLANLKIVERHQHVRTVPYVDPGRDATIYHGQKDFKLQNSTDAPLYISYRTNRSHAIVSLFGKGVPGRKVRLIASHRRLGERHYIGTFNRVVYEPGSAPQRGQPFHSDYKWPETLDFSR
ncbi:MAG: VanW family protein [Armatimonadota bacterium]|nr:VanW family protein [Armatimonadota bacterium]